MITICPSTPFDAKGLLLEAARSQSPVAFLERGRLYRSEPPKDDEGNSIAAMAEYWNVPIRLLYAPNREGSTRTYRGGTNQYSDYRLGDNGSGSLYCRYECR